MKISDILETESVIADLEATDKKDALKTILNSFGDNIDLKQAYQDIMTREDDYSTGLEEGIAFPHARTTAVKALKLAFAVSRKGIEFNSRDGKPSHFIPLLLTPRSSGKSHIIILAEMIRKLEDSDVRNRILQCSDPREIWEIITA